MRLHITLREEPLDGTDLRVVVRCGVWNNDRIRDNFPRSTREAHEELPTDTVLISDTGERHSEASGDHYDIVVADLSDEILTELLGHFSEEITNSARTRPGRPPAQGLLPAAEKGTL